MVKKLIILITVLITVFFVKNLYYQEVYYNQAIFECNNKNYIKCIDNYEKVILAYTPFSNKVHKSVYSLYSLCKEIDRLDEKIYCYETLASSISQIRSLYDPYSDVKFNAKSILVELKSTNIKDTKYKDLTIIKDAYHKITFYDEYSSPFWSLTSVLSLFMWIGLVIYSIMYLDDLSTVNKNLIYLITLFFFLLWIVGLYLA